MKFYMLVLALDTTTRQGSAAVTRDGGLIATYSGDASITHGERLPGDLIRLLDAHGLRVADVDLFAVAAGPGSFTGLRVGIATQQGLALANSRPLVGVSALDAINHAVRSPSAEFPGAATDRRPADVCAWMDAQRGQVFAARYVGDVLVDGPLVEKPGDVLSGLDPAVALIFAGDGAIRYQELIGERCPRAEIVPHAPLLAPSVAWLAEEYVRRHGPMPPDAMRPIYIRRSDAEIARDRSATGPARAPRTI